jgi:hypothetical protein
MVSKMQKITSCHSINPSTYGADYGNSGFYAAEHDDLQYFRRLRQCDNCGDDFETAEIETKFLTELTKLRSALAEIRFNATTFEMDAMESAKGFNKLAKWIAALKSGRGAAVG